MNIVLDHIVHFVKEHPKMAIKKWEERGYQAVMGGSHKNWGTFNSLLYVGDAYIEYLAIENKQIAAASDNPLIAQCVADLTNGEGLGQICFRTDNIIRLKEQLESKGCVTYPIFNGSRKRQDGSIINWKMLFIKNRNSLPYPFFIEWEQPDNSRMCELQKLGFLDEKLLKHTIQSIHIAVHNCEKTANDWAELFQFPISNLSTEKHRGLKIAKLQAGQVEIIFLEPLNKECDSYSILKRRGERHFEISFNPMLENHPFYFLGAYYQ
ncbi:hypothetical protein J2Z40_000291 [Cytobacillus eiseniae]|uniref:Glyoxalase-like domain-containing protein n=1 Tax=Cytobacillus eiseniae TaxID=762947 RepID=A0ABS4RA12_9BACI|nr:VOC family protein [Cytobacillus eiseniae]MBP2239738.1 hypothetical protein [Cytobacillus eiseniae]